jgi:type VI secretion system protein ImpB
MAVNDEIPKSRLTLTYRTDVHGEKEDVALPFRLLVMGDLSGGTSKDSKEDLDQRRVRNLDGKNLNSIMSDMDMNVSFTVDNKIDPSEAEQVDVELPINSMNSFSPSEVAASMPKVKALALLRKLLLEVQGNLDNRKEFRQLIQALSDNPEAVTALKEELSAFDSYAVPSGKAG